MIDDDDDGGGGCRYSFKFNGGVLKRVLIEGVKVEQREGCL
jgi:hypothetical protein